MEEKTQVKQQINIKSNINNNEDVELDNTKTALPNTIPKTKISTSLSKSNQLLPDLQQIEQFANSVKNSAMAKAFEHKGKDGKMVVDVGDIIAAVTLGWDMGISPPAALMLGRKLNANSYFSVLRGKELGLDAITSMSKIYIIPTQNGDIIALDVSIITKAIIDSGTEIHYIRTSAPTPTYTEIKSGRYLGHKYMFTDKDDKIKDDYFIYVKGVNDNDVKEANGQGKIILIQSGITHVTSVRLIRKSHNIDETFHYSLQEATDAGLYRGFHSSLIDSKTKNPLYITGRDNWNNHPFTMLRNRITSIGGRIVVADKLQGSYSKEEVMEIVNVQTEDELQTLAI